MENEKNKVTEAQKLAQKKYDKKTKMISVKYTPADMKEYDKLKNYLDKADLPVNAFIKGLIKEFFDSGKDITYEDENQELINKPVECYPYSWIDEENIIFLKSTFGEELTEEIFAGYRSIFDDGLQELTEEKGCNFDDWVEDIKERIEDGEMKKGKEEEFCRKLIEDMWRNI